MLVPAPINWEINRLFTGPWGIFFAKRIIASPNKAVRSSRSYLFASGPGPSCKAIAPASLCSQAGYRTDAIGLWLFSFLWGLVIGHWEFQLLLGNRFIQVEQH